MRMTKTETERGGEIKPRGEKREVSSGKGENNEKSTPNQERAVTAQGNCIVSKVFDAC